jgi:uncharacterized protein
MDEAEFAGVKDRIIHILSTSLDPKLTYHRPDHTLDVLDQAINIARAENIQNESDLGLLKLASVYHDTGFLYTYEGHEELSCEIFLKDVMNTSFSDGHKSMVCGMIMATKIPQSPNTILESIICDADLDYLGRQDFFAISERLKLEFLHFGIVKTVGEWERRQINFFENHNYFTSSSQQKRNHLKLEHLNEIRINLK